MRWSKKRTMEYPKIFDIKDQHAWPGISAYYRDNGHVVIDSGLEQASISALADDLDIWFKEDNFPSNDYAMKDRNRIQDAWRFDRRIRSAATDKRILKLLNFLYDGAVAKPFQTLNFRNGTQQPVHSDSIHFNSEPFGMMCGVWLALEDIGEDQGPLVYYPGSQKYPEMNFEELGLKAKGGDFKEYSQAIRHFIEEERLQPAYAHLKKGQALIWSANLLHGGSMRNSDKTRLSQVTHYYFEGCKYWRPSQSVTQRVYFEPEWISLKEPNRLNIKMHRMFQRVKRLFSGL